jgi:hypothetical protein
VQEFLTAAKTEVKGEVLLWSKLIWDSLDEVLGVPGQPAIHMRREWNRSWAKPGIQNLMLITLFFVCHLGFARANVSDFIPFQASAPPPAVMAQDVNSGIQNQHGAQGSQNSLGPPDQTASKPQLAPPSRPWPFLRLASILLLGLAISAARLARTFRRFLGLGVFTNAYSALFLMVTIGISGLPVMSEATLSTHLGSLVGPWIADLSGVIAAMILPAIHFKARAVAASPVLDLEGSTSSNPVLAAIEDGIRDHILVRMQVEIVAASRRYKWDEIKLTARRVLEEEITVGRLDRQNGEIAIRSIEEFQPLTDSRRDFDNKYTALIRLLRCCPFSRLRLALANAAIETRS